MSGAPPEPATTTIAATTTSPTAPKKSKPPREVDYADVDDVIGIASEMQNLDQDRLSVEDLESVASEIDIPSEYVRPAIVELRRRRAAMLEARAKKLRLRRNIIIAASALVAALVLWAIIGQNGLASLEAEAEAQRAQVRNVVDSRRRVHAVWDQAPESRERTAALAGAETRVNREKQRYDEAVRAYNGSARSFPGSLWAALFGLPQSLETSDQVSW
ncbi:MAG: LemA family protein [Myxococcota bacterium]